MYADLNYRNGTIPELESYYRQIAESIDDPLLKLSKELIDIPFFRHLFKLINTHTLPGDLEHILMRKKIIFEEIEQLTCPENDTPLIIFLGAGLDPLGFYLSESKEIDVWELDAPSTAYFKQSHNFLNEHVTIFSDEKVFLKNDIPDHMDHVIVVAEGFWPYQSAQDNRRWISTLGRWARQSMRFTLLSTYFNFPEMDEYDRTTIQRSTRAVGEEIINTLTLTDFTKALKAEHITLSQIRDTDEMRRDLRDLNLTDSMIDEFYLLRYDYQESC